MKKAKELMLEYTAAEPLRGNHPYRRADNLLATPHIGYVSRGLYENVNNISAWLDERLLSTTKEN